MEDALRDSVGEFRGFFDNVLILVLMEDALRDVVKNPKNGKLFCLNPCSNGRCSARIKTMTYLKLEKSLNPCSNGRCSARTLSMMTKNSPICLNPCSNGRCSASIETIVSNDLLLEVLILVLMEDALRVGS